MYQPLIIKNKDNSKENAMLPILNCKKRQCSLALNSSLFQPSCENDFSITMSSNWPNISSEQVTQDITVPKKKSWLSVSDLDIIQQQSSLLLEWKSPVCLINSSTVLTIISNDTAAKEVVLNITIDSSCSNKRGKSSIQLNRNSLSLICADGRITQLPQPLILKPCFKYAVTMVPLSTVSRKSVESKPFFFIANLIFEDIMDITEQKMSPNTYKLEWSIQSACFSLNISHSNASLFTAKQTNVSNNWDTRIGHQSNKLSTFNWLEGCNAKYRALKDRYLCRRLITLEPCMNYEVTYENTKMWNLLYPSVSNLIVNGLFTTEVENPYLTLSWNLDCRSDANHTFHLQVFDSANANVQANYSVNCYGDNKVCSTFLNSSNRTGSNTTLTILPCSSYNITIIENLSLNVNVRLPPRKSDGLVPKNTLITGQADRKKGLKVDIYVPGIHYRCSRQLNYTYLKILTDDDPEIPVKKAEPVIGLPCNLTPYCSKTINSLSYFDMCRSHRVEIGLMYHSRIYSSDYPYPLVPTTWFNATFPASITYNDTKERVSIVRDSLESFENFTLKWSDPMCIPSNISFWKILFESETSDVKNISIVAPSDCITKRKINDTGSSNLVHIIKGQVVSCSTVPQHKLESCSDYNVQIIPVINAQLSKYYQIGDFKTPFYSQSITNITMVSVTNDSFILEWNIPTRCGFTDVAESAQISINGSIIKMNLNDIQASKVSSTDTTKYKRIRWTYPSILIPCMIYEVRVGSASLNIITLPNKPNGTAKNMTFEDVTSDGVTVTWDHPNCALQKPKEWRIEIKLESKNVIVNTTIQPLITKSGRSTWSTNNNLDLPSVASRMARPNQPSLSLLEKLKPCETYYVRIGAGWSPEDVTHYYTKYQEVQTKCPQSHLATILGSVVAFLMLVAMIIMTILFISRSRKRRRTQDNLNGTEMINLEYSADGKLDVAVCSPIKKERPIRVTDLNRFDSNEVKLEFHAMKNLAEAEAKLLSCKVARKRPNKIKNRFINTLPFDYNRVVLTILPNNPNSDYINASFVQGFKRENEYVAAQGPKQETLIDFWRMIWEKEVQLIIMATLLEENGKAKCEQYWPDKGALTSFGDIQLKLENETKHSFYTDRTINALLKTLDGIVTRTIKQLHFIAWPDFESPDDPEELIRLVEIARQEMKSLNHQHPILVHCSAGVGRTGTLIALDILIQEMKANDQIDILKTTFQLRRCRVNMIQSESQYVFLHECLAHYAKTRLKVIGNKEAQNVIGKKSKTSSVLSGPTKASGEESVQLSPQED